MSQSLCDHVWLTREMEEVEKAIVSGMTTIEMLRERRYELIIKKEDLKMNEVIDCAIENGISAQELMELVNITSKERAFRDE